MLDGIYSKFHIVLQYLILTYLDSFFLKKCPSEITQSKVMSVKFEVYVNVI